MFQLIKREMSRPVTFPLWAFLGVGFVNLLALAVWILARIEV